MKGAPKLLAAFLLAFAVGFWLAQGRHRRSLPASLSASDQQAFAEASLTAEEEARIKSRLLTFVGAATILDTEVRSHHESNEPHSEEPPPVLSQKELLITKDRPDVVYRSFIQRGFSREDATELTAMVNGIAVEDEKGKRILWTMKQVKDLLFARARVRSGDLNDGKEGDE